MDITIQNLVISEPPNLYHHEKMKEIENERKRCATKLNKLKTLNLQKTFSSFVFVAVITFVILETEAANTSKKCRLTVEIEKTIFKCSFEGDLNLDKYTELNCGDYNMYAAKTDAPLCAKHLVCEEFYLHIYEASAKITMRDGKRINPPPTRQISVLLQSPDIRNKYGTGKIVIDLGSRWKRLRVVGKIVHIVSDSSSTELKTTITFQADKKLAKKKNILPASTIGNECLMYDANGFIIVGKIGSVNGNVIIFVVTKTHRLPPISMWQNIITMLP